MGTSAVFVGIRGDVMALDRTTGATMWRAQLKGADFVTVLVDGDRVLAVTKGEVFCLDAATGERLWHNNLPGEGRGLATIATANGSTNALPVLEQRRQAQAASDAAATAG